MRSELKLIILAIPELHKTGYVIGEQIEFSALKMVNTSLLKGLEEFVKIILHIETNYKRIKISIDIIQLPQFKNFSKYEDGSIRTCAVVTIHSENRMPCLVLEIGRVDF